MAGENAASSRASTTHYDRIGGAPTVREAVDRFYALVLDDPDLAPYFDGVDVGRVKRHQVLLLSQVLGGPPDYDGRALSDAHRGLGITTEHYAKVAAHLVGVLDDMGAPEEVVTAVRTTVAGVQPEIVEQPGRA
ncbi:MAG TPA: group 1 truncated hemoglobin [Acidimicrobiales bacterium]